jgi:tetratricopeptide (TPR) repeat protein
VAVALFLLDRYLGNSAPWRSWARDRHELDALARGGRYLEEGRYRRAIHTVSLVDERSRHRPEALAMRGLAEAALEAVGPARRDLERSWAARPKAETARVLAAIYLSAYEHERGLQMLLNASRLEPSDFRPWYSMGQLVYLRLRRYDRAIEAFQEALKRQPGHMESRLGLIEALLKAHRPEQAEGTLSELLKERPDDPKVMGLAAQLGAALGRDDEALRYLQKSLALEPDNREALILHARLRLRSGRPRDALSEAERAAALEPRDRSALGLLSTIQAALGMKEESAVTVARRQAVERDNEQIEGLMRQILDRPDDPGLRCRLGAAARKAGMTPLAIQCYQAALAIDPRSDSARQGLIDLDVLPSEPASPARPLRGGDNR